MNHGPARARWIIAVGLTGAAGGCALYDPSLLPRAQADDAAVVAPEAGDDDRAAPTMATDAGIADVQVDAREPVTPPPDARPDTNEPPAPRPDASNDEVSTPPDAQAADREAGPAEGGAVTCDATCMARCADEVMDGDETGVDCGGQCPKPPTACPAPKLSNLVVNDTSTGGDGIVNKDQWSIQPSFASGLIAYGDRTYTIGQLSPGAQHLAGKPWIQPATDSRNYTTVSPPVATVNVVGTAIFVGIDARHTTTMLSNAGYLNTGYSYTLNEGVNLQTFNVWRKPIASSAQTLPSMMSTTGSFYLVVVE